MRGTRIGLAAAGLLAASSIGVQPAAAGGSTWDISPEQATPGALVHAEAVAAWAHNDRLGTPGNGPWHAWIRPVGSGNPLDGGGPIVPDDAVPVGDITVTDEGGFGTATVEFPVPHLPAGDYELVHCNDPCTTTLGDITWGLFTIKAPAGAQLAPDAQPPPTEQHRAAVTGTSAPAKATAAAPAKDDAGSMIAVRRTDVVGALLALALLAGLHIALPRHIALRRRGSGERVTEQGLR